MSQDAPIPIPPADPVAPAVASPPRRSGTWLSLLALALAALSLMAVGLMWQKLDFTQKELARRSQDHAAQASETRTVATQAEAQVKELQARLAIAEVRLSEVSLQRSQLEELMLALSRSRDDNLVQDLESALRLAQQQTQLTGSVQPLLATLQAADERIARAAQPRLNPVQRAIARDVQRIRGATVADVPSLVQRLDELVRRVDHWPVPNEVGPLATATRAPAAAQRASDKPVPPKADKAAAKAQAAAPATKETPAGAPSGGPDATPPEAGQGGVLQAWNGFWRRVWDETTRSGRELVRVSRVDRPDAVLLAPEQAFFLRENVKLRLLNARLGLLARQMDAVQDDLRNIDIALARHFDTAATEVSAAQAVVTQLRGELSSTQLPRPEETLAALSVAAGGR